MSQEERRKKHNRYWYRHRQKQKREQDLQKAIRNFRNDPLYDENILKHIIIPIVKQCLTRNENNNYQLMLEGDCKTQFLDILEALSDAGNLYNNLQIICFTPTHAIIYVPDPNEHIAVSFCLNKEEDAKHINYDEKSNKIKHIDISFHFNKTTNKNTKHIAYTNAHGLERRTNTFRNMNYLLQYINKNNDCDIHGYFIKEREVPRRGIGMPFGLNENKYALLNIKNLNKMIIVTLEDPPDIDLEWHLHVDFT